MNGEEFYQEYKRALEYLGLSWEEKEKAHVTFSQSGLEIRVSYNSRCMSFFIMKLKPASKPETTLFDTVEK